MISPEELHKLLGEIESDRVERTTSTSDTDKFAEAVAAFCNDMPGHRRPGYLILGANNDGSPSGLQVTDQLLQNLAALRSDGNIQPLPAMRVDRFSTPNGDLAVVEVLPSDLPPVRYKGRVYIRVGPRRAIANEQEERILTERRVAQARSFDALPCMGSSLDALALDLFQINYVGHAIAPEVIAENGRELTPNSLHCAFMTFVMNAPQMRAFYFSERIHWSGFRALTFNSFVWRGKVLGIRFQRLVRFRVTC